MATDGDGAAAEPSEEPAATSIPSPGKRNMNKTRRLLPMELRKRRRAAKLQVSAQKKTRASLEPPQAHAKPDSKAAAGERDEAKTQQSLQFNVAVQKGKEASAVRLPALSTNKTSTLTRNKQKSPLAATVTAARLSSLYSASLSRKRIFRPGANVPTTFHVGDLPLDVVPKNKLSILTAYPYPFQRSNSQIKKQALQSFITANGNRPGESGYQTTAVRWQQALHYFVHPADSVPTSLLLNRATAATTSEPLLGGPKGERKREEKAFFTARWNTWQEAFRDAYMNFRRQATSSTDIKAADNSFYIRSSEFVVCFLHGSDSQDPKEDAEKGSTSIIDLCRKHDDEAEPSDSREGTKRTKKRQLCAVMSQSNSRIRKVLHHLNVEYTMPYINTNQTRREVGEFYLLEEELEATRSGNKDKRSGGLIAPVTRTLSTPENMHGTDSLLLFHGHDAVHGLYEFLINRAPMSNQDVPEMYALHPFANASIQSLQVTSFGRVGGSATDPLSEDQTSRAATLFRTEILGFCFPSSAAKLLGVLKEEWEATKSSPSSATGTEVSQDGKRDAQIALRTYMEAVAGAERLNAVKLDEQTSSTHKRQQELEFSKRRMEAVVVTKMESGYDVETTTRTIVARR